MIATSQGTAIRFNESEIPTLGRSARGVVAIRLPANENTQVIGCCTLTPKKTATILLITRNGYGKRISADQVRLQKRGGSGVTAHKSSPKSGELVAIATVSDEDHFIAISEKGETLRLTAKSIPIQSRTSSGVRIMRLAASNGLTSISTLPVGQ
jgi:DNA gyrase subunit A